MNKLIALVLSFSLIFGSVTPSLAQSKKDVATKGVGAVLKESGAGFVGKGVGKQGLGGAAGKSISAGAVGRRVAVPGVSGSASIATGAVSPANISALKKLTSPQLHNQVTAAANRGVEALKPAPKTLSEINEIAAKKDFSQKDASDLLGQIFNVSFRDASAFEFLVLDIFPVVNVTRGAAVGASHVNVALDFYRRSLVANNVKASERGVWAKSITAVSNIGFYGSAKDASLILDTYKAMPAAYQPLAAVASARALLTLGAYDALGELASLAAVEGKLSGQFWSGLQTYIKEQGLNVVLPEVVSAEALPAVADAKLLGAWSALAPMHLNPSAAATSKWVALKGKQGAIIEEPVVIAENQVVKDVELMAPVAPNFDIKLDAVRLPETLSLGALNVPASGVNTVAEEAAASSVVSAEQLASIKAGMNKVLGYSNSGVLSSGGLGKITEKINYRYADVKYAKAVAWAVESAAATAERKFVQKHGAVPSVDDAEFQKMWTEDLSIALDGLAKKGLKPLSKNVKKDVIQSLQDSFNPSTTLTPVSSSVFGKVAQFLRDKRDKRAATKANRAAQEARITGLDVNYPLNLEIAKGEFVPQDYEVSFAFKNDVVKQAFIRRVNKLDSETFILRNDGALLLRSPSGSVRGVMGSVQLEGGEKATQQVYRILAARNLQSRFQKTTDDAAAIALISGLRPTLRTLLSKSTLELQPELAQFLVAKEDQKDPFVFERAQQAFLKSGKVQEAVNAIRLEINQFVMLGKDLKDIRFVLDVDTAGEWGLKLQAFTEGLSSFGQAIAAATKLFGEISSFWTNAPSAAGQVGPALAPIISGLQTKFGLKHTSYAGSALSALGLGISAGSLALFPDPMWAFGGMLSGILVNGIAGNGIIKQTNGPMAKAFANDPVSASSSVASLNAWASAGGMYTYLFLPTVGFVSSWLFGLETGLATMATMFGVGAAAPVVASSLLRLSKIKNTKEAVALNKDGSKKGFWKGIASNLKFGFTGTQKQELQALVDAKKGETDKPVTPNALMKMRAWGNQYLVQMAGRVSLYHFGGMAFNSGPGNYFKEIFNNPNEAMAASFLSVYLTVFFGRKIGSAMMGKGLITDKALIGLSSVIATGAGALSILASGNMYLAGALWAAAGLGFANLANLEQAMALNRPENQGQKSAVSMIYVLGRLSGMATIAYGAFSDAIIKAFEVSKATGVVYGLSLPLAATLLATVWNRKLITEDLRGQIRQWRATAPKKLDYPSLRREAEEVMAKNPNLGFTMPAENEARILGDLEKGIISRYQVELPVLENTMLGLNDKAGLDIHRLEMAEKLFTWVSSQPSLVAGEALTYEQFRNEVEPLYGIIAKARVTGVTEHEIDAMKDKVLNGLMAKYPVSREDVQVIMNSLKKKSALDRVRLTVAKGLYARQLTLEAENEIKVQLQKAPEGSDKDAIVNHVIEKYQKMATAQNVTWKKPTVE